MARLGSVGEQHEHLVATIKSLCRTIVEHQPNTGEIHDRMFREYSCADSVVEFLADRLGSVGVSLDVA